MIKSLHINHFAIIDDLDIMFEQGLTALTGETGAGKSIILESLSLLFGKRSDAQMIRHGHDKAIVRGVFELPLNVSQHFELPNEISVIREIDQSGRHQIKLNDENITLTKLKEIMGSMGSMHAQHETMTLYDKSSYLDYLDQVDLKGVTPLLNVYLVSRSHLIDAIKKLELTQKKKNQSLEKQEFLEYQVKELSSLNLVQGEKELLNDQIEKLKNYDKIVSQLTEAYSHLESEGFGIDAIYHAAKAFDKIKHLDPSYEGISNRLSDAFYEIDDAKSLIYDHMNQMDFDQEAFNLMQERSYELQKIEQKYHKTSDELLLYLKEIKDELDMITDYDGYIKTLEKDVQQAFEVAYDKGLKLNSYRIKLAKILEKEMIELLKDLDLEKAQFNIVFDPIKKEKDSLLESGLDQIDFLISLNEGEPLKPLQRVASGGERARFMFALKSFYAIKQNLSMLILDEIDIGISGKTAAKVAFKMSKLSQMMQLIVITHLPQVAAKANHHYGIFKTKEKDRMVTQIKVLNELERIEMIASMLSDEKLSHFAIEQAKILLRK